MLDRLRALATRLGVRRAAPADPNACTLVAVARDEGRYVAEWLAFHLAIGVSRIVVFDHDSADDTAAVVARAAAREPGITLRRCRPRSGQPPQFAAYEEGLSLARTPWVAFLDLDEFLVPWRDGSLPAFLARVPDAISSVHVNWRIFGSSGRTAPDYDLVTEAFTRCAEPDWAYQSHYKTIARRARIAGVDVHDVDLASGLRAMSDLVPVEIPVRGIAERIVYDGIQVNHYQGKTRPEFLARMTLPRANHPVGGSEASRLEDREQRFGMLDRNETEDSRVQPFLPALRERRDRLVAAPRPAGRGARS